MVVGAQKVDMGDGEEEDFVVCFQASNRWRGRKFPAERISNGGSFRQSWLSAFSGVAEM